MSEATILAFEKAIRDGIILPNGEWSLIPLRSGHGTNWDAILGWVTKAALDEDSNLWIEAELDEDSAVAQTLYKKLTRPAKQGRPVQLGLSVGGRITKYRNMFDATLQKTIRVLEGVALKEISVVGAPAYPTAYVEAITKSLDLISEEPLEDNDMGLKLDKMIENRRNGRPATEGIEGETPVIKSEEEETVVETENLVTDTTTDEEVVKEEESNGVADDGNLATDDNTEASTVADIESNPQLSDLGATLAALTNAIAALQQKVDAPVNKSETPVVETTDVTKAETEAQEDDLDTRIATIVSKTLGDILTPLIGEISGIKKSVEDLATAPVDGSLSVHKHKEDDEHDPFEVLKTRLANKEVKPNSLIGEGVRASLGRR